MRILDKKNNLIELKKGQKGRKGPKRQKGPKGLKGHLQNYYF